MGQQFKRFAAKDNTQSGPIILWVKMAERYLLRVFKDINSKKTLAVHGEDRKHKIETCQSMLMFLLNEHLVDLESRRGNRKEGRRRG